LKSFAENKRTSQTHLVGGGGGNSSSSVKVPGLGLGMVIGGGLENVDEAEDMPTTRKKLPDASETIALMERLVKLIRFIF
jgi:hypothetical protein